jgi:DNA-binding MarR family transcriptional regulator
LEYLKDHDGCRQKDIIREFSFSSSDTASLFDSLNENGLIEYTSENKDRAFLTSKGRDAVRILDKIFSDEEQTSLKGIEKQEYQKFMKTLMKIYFNLRDSANE